MSRVGLIRLLVVGGFIAALELLCRTGAISPRVLLAPSERVVVDVLVESPGELALEHHTPDRTYRLAAITVTVLKADDDALLSSVARKPTL